MVLERSSLAGEIYEGYGRGETIQGLQQRLAGIWEPVWHHDLAKEISAVMDSLHLQKAHL
jgi:salicylate hydroxylase